MKAIEKCSLPRRRRSRRLAWRTVKEVDALSSTLEHREAFFAWTGAKISAYLGKSLGRLVLKSLPSNLLEAQLPSVPDAIEKSYNFTSLFSAEATLNLLERRGCEHVVGIGSCGRRPHWLGFP